MACNRRRSASTSNAAVGHASAEPCQRLDEQGRDRPVAVPLAIRRDDVPRRDVRRRPLDRLPVGRHVLVPQHAVVEVAGVVLPVLRRVVQALEQTCLLLVGRDVQEALHDRRPVRRERLLEALDRAVAPRPGPPVGQLQDADGHDVLVVRAIEDAEHARLRELAADPPQEVVRELLGRRALEGGDVHAGGIDLPQDVADRPALAGRVHALQDEQHLPVAARAAVRVEPLLEVGELRAELRERVAALRLAALEAGCRAGVDRREVQSGRRRAEQIAHARGGTLWHARERISLGSRRACLSANTPGPAG